MELMQLVRAIERSEVGNEYLDAIIQGLMGASKPIPAYTQSVDAAMLLIPTGWSLHRLRHEKATDRSSPTVISSRWAAELYRDGDAFLTIPTHAFAATAPLALCASCLLVRAAVTSEDREFLRIMDAAKADVSIREEDERFLMAGSFAR